MLETFTWPTERLEAGMILFGRIVDPHNQHHLMNTFSGEGKEKFVKILGPLRYFHPANPTGHYNLNLCRQVDYCIATQLLSYYAEEESYGICRRDRLEKSWRNVFMNGKAMEQVEPHSWEIPTTGSLKLDYVSYKLPDAKSGTFNNFSDIRMEALIQVLTFDVTPNENKLKEVYKHHFHTNFLELWTTNFNRQAQKQEKKGNKMRKMGARAMRTPTSIADAQRRSLSVKSLADINTRTMGMNDGSITHPETALAGLRVMSIDHYINCKHLIRLLELFQDNDAHCIELMVIWYGRILDRGKISEVMKRMSNAAQAGFGQRIGPLNIFNPNAPDIHWLLRLRYKDECEVARRLVRIAQKDTNTNSFNDLQVNGRQMPRITEDESLWAVLSGHVMEGMTPTNVLEFDYMISKQQEQNGAAKLIQTRFRQYKKRMQAKGIFGKKKKKNMPAKLPSQE
ncbi:hypothetical protein CYMTET_51359 [Cymbomonas tetramitiformis]|uniref:Uncharacterized protein n=1 Tax=Cymbomonas tetramitiformis TaxID=36881 RepID=A0AAE0ERW7_9CHLO|nr:hypothetical protein CYMTET_51359 [Cymbomonas tetramitiformis]